MKKILVTIMYLCVCGCAAPHTTGSFDGLSARYTGDAQSFAKRTAEELALRHAPAHTTLALERAPGAFGDTLEHELRASGFAVTSSGSGVGGSGIGGSGVGVSYTLDVLSEEYGGALGYVQVASSDGQRFSFSGTVSESTPSIPAAVPAFESASLLPEQPASTTPSTSLSYGVSSPAPAPAPSLGSVPTHPVRRAGSAAIIARRNKIPVEDFCRWNHVAKNDVLNKGHEVYLSEPPAIASQSRALQNVPVVAAIPSVPTAYSVHTMQTTAVSEKGNTQTDPIITAALSDMTNTNHSSGAPGAPVITPVTAATTTIQGIQGIQGTQVTPTPLVAASTAPVATSAITPNEPLPSVVPLVPAVITPEWKLQPGSLHDQLATWAAREGWQIVWKAPDDLDMESHASFHGSFVDAMQQLFEGLYRSGHPVRVTLYQGNNVAEINLQ